MNPNAFENNYVKNNSVKIENKMIKLFEQSMQFQIEKGVELYINELSNGTQIPNIFIFDFDYLSKNSYSNYDINISYLDEKAFEYFKKQKVDIAIIEVGLGGRLDSTNIITPLISVITNIGKDHVQFLGNTLEAIANAGNVKVCLAPPPAPVPP
jgi:hypothetical protein